MFNFGKKKKKVAKEKKETKIIKINKREFDRYILEDENIINISKNGCRIKKAEDKEITQEFIEIDIDNHKIKGTVIKDTSFYYSVKFLNPFNNKEFIKNRTKKIKDFTPKEKKCEIDFEKWEETNSKFKIIVNLLLEIDNPNTTTRKLMFYIDKLPDIKEAILDVANSIESGAKERINTINTAIARIGFDKLKEIIRDTIIRKISFKNEDLPKFEHFESFSVLKSAFLRDILPYVVFSDTRGEAKLLLTNEVTPISFLVKINPNFANFYTSVERLYSPYSRYLERHIFGTDFLKISKKYFVEYSGFFEHLYDGYILAHLNLSPFLNLPKDMKIYISKRKLDFSYVAYLTFLTVLSIIGKDREKQYILINRLKKLGMDSDKALSFLTIVVEHANEALHNMGLRKSLRMFSRPKYSMNLTKLFPKENIYFKYLLNTIDSSLKRITLRHEDRIFNDYMIYFILNAEEYNFKNSSFCIIPCQNIADETELDIDVFSSFDIIVFKDIDLLPTKLQKYFTKIWKDFEGTIICSYSTYSFLDWENPSFYSLIKDTVVDVPSFFVDIKSHLFIQEWIKNNIEYTLGNIDFNKSAIFQYNVSTEEIIYSLIKTVSI